MALFNEPRYPKALPLRGRSLLHTGQGRVPGSQVYLDLTEGRSYELHRLRLERPDASGVVVGELLDCPGVGPVRVRFGDIAGGAKYRTPGDVLLVGPLHGDRAGRTWAGQAWLLHQARSARQRGVINRIHHSGNFGEITTAKGEKLFFHVTQLLPGTNAYVGREVNFAKDINDRGWIAQDIRPG